MDSKVASFYRSIYSDLSVDREEAAELTAFLEALNAPPDKIQWLRSTAFKIGCEFLSDDNDDNVSLLRTINFVVHAIETTCLQPRQLENGGPLDEEAVTSFYKGLYEDLSVDREENAELYAFFQESNAPQPDAMVMTRALAFKVGCESLTDDKETNVSLLRAINCVVHAFEMSCMMPKPFELHDEGVDLSMSLSDAVQHLWDLDANRLDPNEDYRINVQEGKKPYWKEDKAEDPLFDFVDRNALKRPTYASFVALLDNYSEETGSTETVTDAERREVWTFLTAIMETKPMQFCHQYCKNKDSSNVPGDRQGFLKLLHKIWFDLYRRESTRDSSGFEHVFVGEIKDGKISGFHNWIQFYLEEKRGALDYRGYIKPKSSHDARTDDNDQLLTLQFTWKGIEKSVGSSFIGVSPEFEFALYSMCFLVGDEENEVELNMGGVENDTFGIMIKCYKMARDKVGTSFPEIKSHYEA